MANNWNSAHPAVRDRWAGEITPLTPVSRQSPVIPAASMQAPGSGMTGNGLPITPGSMNGSMNGAGMSSGADSAGAGGSQTGSGGQTANQNSSLDMGTGLPDEVIVAPTTVSEAYLTSLKAMLNKNTGNYVVANFLIGTQNMVSWEGILYDVGSDFITIYQEPRERYIVCDIYSLKFIEFFDTRRTAR